MNSVSGALQSVSNGVGSMMGAPKLNMQQGNVPPAPPAQTGGRRRNRTERKNRKNNVVMRKNRKNNVVSRKNRKNNVVSRKNRKNTRKNRKANRRN